MNWNKCYGALFEKKQKRISAELVEVKFSFFSKNRFRTKGIKYSNEKKISGKWFLFNLNKNLPNTINVLRTSIASLILFKIGGGVKNPSYQFSPITFPNVGISPQNLLAFSFKFSATRLLHIQVAYNGYTNFRATFSATSKILNLNQDHSPKNRFFVKSL